MCVSEGIGMTSWERNKSLWINNDLLQEQKIAFAMVQECYNINGHKNKQKISIINMNVLANKKALSLNYS